MAGAGGEDDIPKDAKIVKELLKSMNVDDYEPRVTHQFLELWYRYVVDVLTDAQVYSEHGGKSVIDSDDVKLAIQSKVNFSFSQPPPREALLELALSRNKVPLPKAISGPGIPLPPEQDTLISPNYQLAIPKKHSQPAEETEEDEEAAIPNPNPNPNPSQDLPHDTPQRVSFQLGGHNSTSELKTCFLCLGFFKEDGIIPAKWLIQVWIAEGFITQEGEEMMEEIVRGYLDEEKYPRVNRGQLINSSKQPLAISSIVSSPSCGMKPSAIHTCTNFFSGIVAFSKKPRHKKQDLSCGGK